MMIIEFDVQITMWIREIRRLIQLAVPLIRKSLQKAPKRRRLNNKTGMVHEQTLYFFNLLSLDGIGVTKE